jgi:phosphohistidine phosphatase SixA
MAAASSLTAELESLQTRTTQTLQQIDENFSRANEVAAELFPLAREFVKQLCLADSESKVRRFVFRTAIGRFHHARTA